MVEDVPVGEQVLHLHYLVVHGVEGVVEALDAGLHFLQTVEFLGGLCLGGGLGMALAVIHISLQQCPQNVVGRDHLDGGGHGRVGADVHSVIIYLNYVSITAPGSRAGGRMLVII